MTNASIVPWKFKIEISFRRTEKVINTIYSSEIQSNNRCFYAVPSYSFANDATETHGRYRNKTTFRVTRL